MNWSRRGRLNVEADELRMRLSQSLDRDHELLMAWAKRAARKAANAVDVEAAKAAISSPLEGGGGI